MVIKSDQAFNYLTTDPRTTGEMHPMFDSSYSDRAYDPTGAAGGTGPTSGTPPPCMVIGAGNQPDGWGAAHNVFSSAGELILRNDCTTDGFTPEIGSSLTTASNFAVYTTGYYYDGSDWIETTFSPGPDADSFGAWILGAAVGEPIDYRDGENTFYAAYTCHWRGAAEGWRCGCQDAACEAPAWQLQAAGDLGK